MMPPMAREAWRKEDEALLGRLIDESVAERVFRKLATSTATPPRRAAGLVASLRKTPDGAAVVVAASNGDLSPILKKITLTTKLAGATPELLHQLALFHAAISDAKGGDVDALVFSLVAWLSLAKEGRYLRELAQAVTAGALPAKDLDAALAEVPFWPIDALGLQARTGARELTASACAALEALGRVGGAAVLAEAPEALAKAASLRASTAVMIAVEEALTPVLQALTEVAAKPDPTAAEQAALLKKLAAVWMWSGRDEHVEHAAVEQTAPLAWPHYRASRWTELGMLIEPVWPLVDSLASRIQADPTKITYAASAAQLIGFRSDVTKTRPETLALLERALLICPTHRNTRLRISNELCDDALKLLPGQRAPTHAGYETAKKLIERAEQVYPTCTKLPDAQKRLLEAKNLLGFKP